LIARIIKREFLGKDFGVKHHDKHPKEKISGPLRKHGREGSVFTHECRESVFFKSRGYKGEGRKEGRKKGGRGGETEFR
jgi:hypothetical protein